MSYITPEILTCFSELSLSVFVEIVCTAVITRCIVDALFEVTLVSRLRAVSLLFKNHVHVLDVPVAHVRMFCCCRWFDSI